MKTTNLLLSTALLLSGSVYGQVLNGGFEFNNHSGGASTDSTELGAAKFDSAATATNWTAGSKSVILRGVTTEGSYAHGTNNTLVSDPFFLSVGTYTFGFDSFAGVAANGNIGFDAGIYNAAASLLGSGSYIEAYDGSASSNSFQVNIKTAGQHSLKFNVTSGGGTSTRLFIDNVKSSKVPEPSSTLLLGLGAFSLIMRRRK